MSLTSFILIAVIALIVGLVAASILPVKMPGGWAGAIVAGFIGAWLGPILFGTWGPVVAGFSLIPSLIGSAIVVMVVGIIAKILK